MTRLVLGGDVMLGRGIDQILRHPADPQLYEDYLRSAVDYLHLAERAHGPIPRRVGLDYVWADATAAQVAAQPDWCIVNLETAITSHGTAAPKGINYRMSPQNAEGILRLGISCCVLSNNHVLDWGIEGLIDTLDTLHAGAMATAGAGRTAEEALAPAVMSSEQDGRVLVFGMACTDSGVPRSWAAGRNTPGVNLLPRLDSGTISKIKKQVDETKMTDDLAVASIHWGGNWGYGIPASHIWFARALIDEAGIDLVHGHSSHHAKGWEIYGGKLILYGCGDFINDYEGIRGREEFRADLAAMYLADLDAQANGKLTSLSVVPFNIRRFSLRRAGLADAGWLCDRLNRECRSPGLRFTLSEDAVLVLAHGNSHSGWEFPIRTDKQPKV